MIQVTSRAWNKIHTILNNKKTYAFIFSATGGGCNGFNYNLKTISHADYTKQFNKGKMAIYTIINNDSRIIVDPMSEMLLIGTKIDYISEDFDNNVFENKFIFTPQKDKATTCGCGTSFSPRPS